MADAPGVVWIPWYATVLRQDRFAAAVSQVAPLALRYGATQYSVHRSREDRYRITQMAWFRRKEDWYRYWDGAELRDFRQRNYGHYQIPIVYAWNDEIASGALGPEVPMAPEPGLVPPAAA